ncbi:DNA internalization-related competence protein ComEC/Rec2 [Vibrio diazotrophicus]|uniref:DNA internalization-related competence protein ComEC/Rec2 n=1 Tax=Vibrio diazotrophicus TaxID=685 RepID=UPI00142DE228|nr:DNA internalization-related competence protein ComEC/Rec2 [Vibrio diazotrophicus]NIY91587.1 DNA internalization-related competence protein ComEC/Rec2 [Vibrio diazotrophicus]
MTLLSKNWTLASFSLTVLSSPYWPYMPDLGFALFCPLFIILSVRFTKLRCWGGIVLALLVIITHGNAVKTQSSSIFQAGLDITIKGKVDSFFKQISYGYEGSVAIHQINDHFVSEWFPPRVRLISPLPLQIGEHFEFAVKLKPVVGRLNEVGFDAESYYLSQGWVARASVVNNSRFQIISGLSIRSRVHDTVQTQISSSPFKGMITALMFGERSGLSQTDWTQLRNSGLIHLVAISGLHIGIAFGIGYVLGLGISRLHPSLVWFPFVLGVSFAVSYAWLAGFTLPTQRALIMCLLNVLLIVLRIHVSVFRRILLTLAAVLITDPFASLASSFWLSFIAVCIVIYLCSITVHWKKWWTRFIAGQVILVLLMAPVSAYFFGGISWVSTLFNMVFIPWFSFFIIPMLFVAVIATCLDFPYIAGLWQLVDFSFQPLAHALPYATSGWINISEWLFQLMLVLTLIGLLRTIVSRFSQVLIVVVLAGTLFFRTPSYDWRIDVLDVGHGLAVVIEKEGKTLLYDTGSSWDNGSYVRSVIAPLLAKRGADTIDTVIYSHFDDDHAGGREDVDQLLSPSYIYTSQYLKDALACVRGEEWQWQGLYFSVLWPPKRVDRAFNQHSCVVRVSDMKHTHSVLLSGDVTAVGEWLLARDNAILQSDVMIVPHHGSKTSSTVAFIERVSPKLAIASLDKTNRWNLPNPEIVKRYTSLGAEWYDTGESGQITLRYRAESRHLTTLRRHGLIPWYRQMLRKEVE